VCVCVSGIIINVVIKYKYQIFIKGFLMIL